MNSGGHDIKYGYLHAADSLVGSCQSSLANANEATAETDSERAIRELANKMQALSGSVKDTATPLIAVTAASVSSDQVPSNSSNGASKHAFGVQREASIRDIDTASAASLTVGAQPNVRSTMIRFVEPATTNPPGSSLSPPQLAARSVSVPLTGTAQAEIDLLRAKTVGPSSSASRMSVARLNRRTVSLNAAIMSKLNSNASGAVVGAASPDSSANAGLSTGPIAGISGDASTSPVSQSASPSALPDANLTRSSSGSSTARRGASPTLNASRLASVIEADSD